MNVSEAQELLRQIISGERKRSYEFWEELMSSEDDQRTSVVQGKSGASYQVQIRAFVEDQNSGDIRVIFAIDDGGLRAFVPITQAFVMARDGSFVGD